jgi:hypothetical protein
MLQITKFVLKFAFFWAFLHIVSDGDRFLIFLNSFWWSAYQSGFRSKDPSSCNIGTTTPLVINCVAIHFTLPQRLIPAYGTKNTEGLKYGNKLLIND